MSETSTDARTKPFTVDIITGNANPIGETWATMRMSDVNRIVDRANALEQQCEEHEANVKSLRAEINNTREALGCPDTIGLLLWATRCGSAETNREKAIIQHKATIASLRDDVEKAQDDARRMAHRHDIELARARAEGAIGMAEAIIRDFERFAGHVRDEAQKTREVVVKAQDLRDAA